MDASYDLEVVVIAALRADEAVSAIVGARIYDRVPSSPAQISPYISMGPSDASQDDADCIEAEEITFQVDCWSWGDGEAFGSAEVRQLSGAVKRCLHDAELALSENALVTLDHRITRVMRDPDGVTNHAAMTFSAFVENG